MPSAGEGRSMDKRKVALSIPPKAKIKKQEVAKPTKRSTPTLLELWELMRKLHFPTLSISTIEFYETLFEVLTPLHHFHLEEITPSVIDKWIEDTKKFYLAKGDKRRKNLKRELICLTTIFNWYRNEPEYGDYRFISPVLKRHKKSCIVRPLSLVDKKIAPEDAFKFINLMPPLYRDLALFQYLTASRIGEAAGVQIRNINLAKKELIIKECCIWSKTKGFIELKAFPKNGQIRYCHVNDLLEGVIERRLAERVPGCDYLFHKDGKPLGYRWIQHAYIRAQKKAKIPHRSTHILRHGMATLTRHLTRSLDATMAMTGHKDIKLADHYSEIGKEVQRETSLKVEEHLKELLQKSAVLGCTGPKTFSKKSVISIT